MEVTFVSTNQAKRRVVLLRAKKWGIKVNTVNLELYEEQSMSVREVAKSKAMYAYSILKKPLFIDDRGLIIPALNGFPGALLKFTINTIGAEGIVKLMENKKNRKAYFETATAFMSSELKKPIVFSYREHGSILDEVRSGKLHRWTDIIRIFSTPMYSGRALSELTDNEWNNYQEDKAREDHIEKLFSWLAEKKKL
ncbi:MAG: hypothetical protein CSMARM4_0054 [Candidatus Parvarchaeum acidiphilum ARMAN-4_'5-way FS']|jgi:XTP/dITP diphosphohydrolase|uniref:Non-canonical purine NTP pyrophosphatase n=1 Tax=Candidatus Parvarchaeum acidiphilum ARMAN-4_'5-way FS' TaxID=994837 RepID=F2UTX4_PARA4|nr:MAG: hypothetical protein CSMARM4_0054 [Candidatus Parvarchaeum acidiphilum ARMAN-4_'5-way FS']